MNVTKWDARQAATRSKLLQSAQELIAAEGVGGLSVRRLASAAEVAVGTIYNHFGDRAGVLSALAQDGLETLAVALDDHLGDVPLNSTRALMSGLLDRYETDEDIWRPLFLVLKSEPGDHGLGVSGERLLAFMLADLRTAEAADMLLPDIDLPVLARHLLDVQLTLLIHWAFNRMTIAQYRERSVRSMELTYASVLNEPHRATALALAGIR